MVIIAQRVYLTVKVRVYILDYAHMGARDREKTDKQTEDAKIEVDK